MRFKMITLSEKEVARIAGNAGTHAEMMARALTDRWRRYLPKEQQVIDVLQLQRCVHDDLHRLRVEIREIESEHLERLESARLGREVRDVAIPQLRARLIGIQRLFDGNFGAGSSTLVFGEETVSIPTDPFPLLRVGHFAHQRLTAPGFELPASRFEGVKIVPRSLAKSFEPPLAELDDALHGLEQVVPATSVSLEKKLLKLRELQTQAGIAARFLEALYFLAGHGEVARRVRLSTRRARDADANEDGSGANDGAGEAGEAAAGAAASAPAAPPEAMVTAPAAGAARGASKEAA